MKKINSRFLLLLLVMLALLPACKKYYSSSYTDNNDQSAANSVSGSEAADDYTWGNSKIIHIVLNGNSITTDNDTAAVVNGSSVTLKSAATYDITGSLTDGQVIVKTEDTLIVRLILDGANISCSSSAPIYVKSARKVMIVMADNTQNSVTDGKSYIQNSDNEPNAAIFSKSYLSFFGNGSLTVRANFDDGITSKDGMVIKNGKLNVTAVDDGIRGKDYLIIRDADITVTAGGDGFKSDNEKVTGYGYIIIQKGIFNINSVNDGIHARYTLDIQGGTYNINNTGDVVLTSSGSGYDPSYSEGIKSKGSFTLSNADITIKSSGKAGKGISCDKNISMTSGVLNITTTGAGGTYKNTSGVTDAYHSTCITADGNISITGGSVTTSSYGTAGKGIACDGALAIGDENNSPTINVTTTGAKILLSSSGMNSTYAEAKAIKSTGAVTINNGIVTISSADDGIKSHASITINNATVSILKSYEGMESPAITVNSGNVSIISTDDGFNATMSTVAGGTESNDGSLLTINGGKVVVSSSTGDAIDSNGNFSVTGGILVAHGPAAQPEVGMDVNGYHNVSGGFLVISGIYSNMTQTFSTTSSQYSVLTTTNSALSTSTLFHIQDATGTDILTFQPARNYSSIIFSSSSLKSGSTYSIYTGGSSTGTNSNGLYSGGVYSGGTLRKNFTISGQTTNISF